MIEFDIFVNLSNVQFYVQKFDLFVEIYKDVHGGKWYSMVTGKN